MIPEKRALGLMRLLIALISVAFMNSAVAQPDQCRAIDGDTFVCFGERIRLENIDAPELHARCSREMDAAQAAKLFAQTALDGATLIEVLVHQRRPRDRYGRTLAHVRVDGADLGQLLIDAGLARSYHGERRTSWCE